MQVRVNEMTGGTGEIPEDSNIKRSSIFYGENCLFLINGAEVCQSHDTVAVSRAKPVYTSR